MGFFDLKAVCGVCDREVGLNRFKVKSSDAWVCPECLKKAGGPGKVNVSKITIDKMKSLIKSPTQKEDQGGREIKISKADEIKKLKELLDS